MPNMLRMVKVGVFLFLDIPSNRKPPLRLILSAPSYSTDTFNLKRMSVRS